jgi:DNA-3-methyladenine glycosylase I
MAEVNSYCKFVANKPLDDLHRQYHDTEYGFPLYDDNEMFGRLILEINQAGLSWDLMLKKKHSFRAAYAGFDIQQVAAFDEADVARLLNDAGIIRNKLKVRAAIYNAQQIVKMQEEHGSFAAWLDLHHPKELGEWVKLFKKTFKFTGGEITNEFLMSIGYLAGSHDENCTVYHQILSLNPRWNQ